MIGQSSSPAQVAGLAAVVVGEGWWAEPLSRALRELGCSVQRVNAGERLQPTENHRPNVLIVDPASLGQVTDRPAAEAYVVLSDGTDLDPSAALPAGALLLVLPSRPLSDPTILHHVCTTTPAATTVLWNAPIMGRSAASQWAALTRQIAQHCAQLLHPGTTPTADDHTSAGQAKTVQLRDGTQLAYTEYGQGPLVIITAQMGFPSEPNYPSLLAQAPVDARVLAVTLRGFRPSNTVTDDLGSAWLDQWADDIAELADHLGIGTFVYTGGSHGGGVGWYLTQRHPHRLHAYIGVVSGPHDREDDPTSSSVRRAINNAWPDETAVRRLVEQGVFGPPTHPARAERRAELIDGIVTDYHRMLPEEARINQGKPWPHATTDDELAAILRTITVPTLLLSGMQDVIITTGASIRASTSVPAAKSVLWQEEGHMTWEEAPGRLTAQVALYLDDLGLRRR